MSIRTTLTTLTFLPALAACSRQGPSADSSVGPAWVVDSVPVTDIAGTTPSGDAAFLSVVGAVHLSDGTIVVADPYDAKIRYFDSAGQQIHAYGRAGKGPGEFGRLMWLGRCGGDSLFVWDDQNRLSVLDPIGRLARQVAVPVGSANAPPPVFFACGPDGPLATLTPNPKLMVFSQTSDAFTPGVLAMMDREGRVTRIVDSVLIGQGRTFARYTQLAVSGDRVFVGPEDSARVLTFALDGSSRGMVRIGVPDRPVSDREYERGINRQVAVFSSPSDRAFAKKVMLRHPKPKTLAPYFALFAVGHDTLWAQISAPGDSVTVLDAVGPDGSPAGEARIPRDLRVLDMGRDFILGEYDAPDGDQHVALYRMHRPAMR